MIGVSSGLMIQCERFLYGIKTRRWRGANRGAWAASGGRPEGDPPRAFASFGTGTPGRPPRQARRPHRISSESGSIDKIGRDLLLIEVGSDVGAPIVCCFEHGQHQVIPYIPVKDRLHESTLVTCH